MIERGCRTTTAASGGPWPSAVRHPQARPRSSRFLPVAPAAPEAAHEPRRYPRPTDASQADGGAAQAPGDAHAPGLRPRVDPGPATLRAWLTEPLDPPVAAAIDRLRRADDVRHVAVMPDVHLAADVCVGTVLATDRLLYPGAVGGDIGCGMLALAFDAGADLLSDPPRPPRCSPRLARRGPAGPAAPQPRPCLARRTCPARSATRRSTR